MTYDDIIKWKYVIHSLSIWACWHISRRQLATYRNVSAICENWCKSVWCTSLRTKDCVCTLITQPLKVICSFAFSSMNGQIITMCSLSLYFSTFADWAGQLCTVNTKVCRTYSCHTCSNNENICIVATSRSVWLLLPQFTFRASDHHTLKYKYCNQQFQGCEHLHVQIISIQVP